MAVKFIQSGGDSTFDVSQWQSVAGAAAVASDFVHGSHLRSIKYRPGNQDIVGKAATAADAGGRISVYLYLAALPSSTDSILNVTQTAFGTSVIRIRLTSTGVLQLWDGVAQRGSNGSTLATGVWYRICMAWKITSSSVNDVRIFKNGVTDISVTNTTITTVTSADILLGNASSDGSLDMRSSDHYIDDSNSLLDTGDIWVTAKRDVANGSINGFTTQIGSGGSGYGTGHAPQVNERALSTTNGWSMIGAGSAITEEYTIEAASVGDIDISRATLIDYMGWVYAKALASETASIVVGGATSNISLTSTNTMFTKMADSAIYPTGGTDIGIVTTTALTTVSLYECGVEFAYIPATLSKLIATKQAINRASTY